MEALPGRSAITLTDRGRLPPVVRETADAIEFLRDRGLVLVRSTAFDAAAQARFVGRILADWGGDDAVAAMRNVQLETPWDALAMPAVWHVAMCGAQVPALGSALCTAVSTAGWAAIEFADTAAAYARLPSDIKARCASLRVVHSQLDLLLSSDPEPHPDAFEAAARLGRRELPLVCEGGRRKGLVLGATTREVVGLEAGEGALLLAGLREWSTRPGDVYRHRWQPGDLLVWNNLVMLHRTVPGRDD